MMLVAGFMLGYLKGKSYPKVYRSIVTVGQVGSGADYICDGVDDAVVIKAAMNEVNPRGGMVMFLLGKYKY